MGTWFRGRANVRHLCQDKGYNYARVSTVLRAHPQPQRREGAARNASGPVLGSGTDLCLAEGLP